MPEKQLLVVIGPTASGKTAMAIRLAQQHNTVVVSADSRQVYKELPIGSAAPDASELATVPHYFIGTHSIHEPLDAAGFAQLVRNTLTELFQQYDTVVLCGGSGMYVDGILYGFDALPENLPEVREKWNTLYREKGLAYLQEELKSRDPEYYQKVDLNNPARLIRALEVCDISGKPYSQQLSGKTKTLPWKVKKYAIDWPREVLYARINERVDAMLRNGLLEEARNVYPFRHLSSLQTVGYTELFDYFDGKYTLEEAVDKIKQHTRNLAKRQLTWWRRDEEIEWGRFEC